MGNRQEQNSGTREVREAHKFDLAPLDAFMRKNIDGYAGGLAVTQFKGGQSNPTYLLTTDAKSYVLRRKPPGKLLKSAHAVDREFRVIGALYDAGFPVPKPYAFCEDESVLGTAFYLMEFVEGRVFWELDLPQLSSRDRRALYDNVNQTIAKLHNYDFSAIGLGDFGRPGNYFSRQISRWSQQYKASEIELCRDMDRLIEWLPENIPSEDGASVVHGDFRLDNMIVHPHEPRVIAVLDWELSTIGHPLGDFTYHLMPWQMPEIGIGSAGLLGRNLSELGIPSEEEYVTRYCQQTGRSDGIENRNFYSAYNFFRLAAILQGIAGRVRDGTAASAHAASATKAVRPLAETGWQHALRASDAT